MRTLAVAVVAAFAVILPFLGPPATVRAQGAVELLPQLSDLAAALAPFTVSNYTQGPGTDGWDVNETFEVGGTPDGSVIASVDAAVLPTSEGAAGFLQTKLQQLRSGAGQSNLIGDLGPASPEITRDADEAYFGVYMTPDGAPNRGLMAIVVSRYENQVTAVQTMMGWEGSGSIPENAKLGVGAVLGLVGIQVNELASEE